MDVFPEEPQYTEMNEHAIPLGIVLITLLALVLRLYGLASQSFWIDELITLEQGRAAGSSLWQQFLDDYHNPIPMLVVTWLGHLGRGEALLRLPTALLGAFSVPLIYRLGSRLMGPRTGLLAALLLAVHPFHIYHSQELRGYAWMLFFGLAATLVATGNPKRFSWGRASALLLLGIATALSNLEGLLWMGSLGLACMAAGMVRAKDLPRWGLALGGVLLVTTPWWSGSFSTHEPQRLLPGEETGELIRGETTFDLWALPYAGFVLAAGNTLDPTPRELNRLASEGATGGDLVPRQYWPGIAGVGGLTLVLLVTGIRALGRKSLWLLIWVALPVLFASWLAWRNVKPFNPRYVIVMLPALLLVVAAALDFLPRRASMALLIAWLCFQLLADYRYHFVPEYGRDDVRGAAKVVQSREGPHDFVLAPTIHPVFRWYYAGRNPVEPYWSDQVDSPEAAQALLSGLRPERRFIWFVRCRPWHDDPEGWLLAALNREASQKALFQLPGVELYLFDRGGAD